MILHVWSKGSFLASPFLFVTTILQRGWGGEIHTTELRQHSLPFLRPRELVTISIGFVTYSLSNALLNTSRVAINRQAGATLLGTRRGNVGVTVTANEALPIVCNAISRVPFTSCIVCSGKTTIYSLGSTGAICSGCVPTSITIGIVRFLLGCPICFRICSSTGRCSRTKHRGCFAGVSLPHSFLRTCIGSVGVASSVVTITGRNGIRGVGLFCFRGRCCSRVGSFLFSCSSVSYASPITNSVRVACGGISGTCTLTNIYRELKVRPTRIVTFNSTSGSLGVLSCTNFNTTVNGTTSGYGGTTPCIAGHGSRSNINIFIRGCTLKVGPHLTISTYLLNRGYGCGKNGGGGSTILTLRGSFRVIPIYPRYFNKLGVPHIPGRVVSNETVSGGNRSFATRCGGNTRGTLCITRRDKTHFTILGRHDPSYNGKVVCSNAFSNALIPKGNMATRLFVGANVSIFNRDRVSGLLRRTSVI